MELAKINGQDEILLYREVSDLNLSDLKQFGPLGREAYRQLCQMEHFTPHTRFDVPEWQNPEAS